MSRIFISYSREDFGFVEQLIHALAARLPDAEIFYDKLIPPGESFVKVLSSAIEQADVFLAVLSPDYVASSWAREEVNVALAQMVEKRTRLLPLLFRPCHVPPLLATLSWIDFTSDYEAAFSRLMWGITGQRPTAAKGEEPGKPVKAIDPTEVKNLRREVQTAVVFFKSRPEERLASSWSVERADKRPAQERRQCFVIMPFGDPDLQVVYEDFVKPTLVDRCNLRCERGNDVFGSNVIMEDVLERISAADVVLADLTRKNANVFYEVGICHALDKPVLLLAQSVDDVPFDLRHRRVLLYEYSPRGCKRLEAALRENMNAILQKL
jgi:hypothetical protein